MAGWSSAYFLGHMRPNLPIVSLVGTSVGKILGLLINLDMNYCSSYGAIDNFGLGNRIVGGSGGNGCNVFI